VPTASVDVVSVATPPVKAADPIVAAPSLNVTDPTGTPPPGAAVTVALKVIGTPKSDGLLLDVTVVAVANEVGVTLIANVCAALVSTPPLVVPPLSCSCTVTIAVPARNGANGGRTEAEHARGVIAKVRQRSTRVRRVGLRSRPTGWRRASNLTSVRCLRCSVCELC